MKSSIRAKTFALLVCSILLYLTLDFAVHRLVVFPRFETLEKKEAEKDLDRCVQAIDREIQAVNHMCADWAVWDDTYQFVHDHNEAYIDANLNADTFTNTNINAIYIVDREGRVVFGQTRDRISGEPIEMAELDVERFDLSSPLLAHVKGVSCVEGLMPTSQGPLCLSAWAIRDTDSTEPPAGTMIMGRLLNEAFVTSLSAQTRVDFSLLPLDAEHDHARHIHPTDNKHEPGDDDVLVMHATYPDLLGKPFLLVEALVPREISMQGQTVLVFAMLTGLFIAILIPFAMGLCLNDLVLSPLKRLVNAVHDLDPKRPIKQRVPAQGQNEIGELGREINTMLERQDEAREQLIEARRQAECAAVAKSIFLANMSHEIRTPMNGVIGMTDLLKDTQLSHEQRDFVNTIRTSGETLLTLINDILDFSKIEAGKLNIQTLDFNLHSLVEDVISIVAEQADKKHIELVCLIHHNLPLGLQGDPGRLRQVLLNLLGNAIKFTHQGEVVLQAHLEKTVDDTHYVRIEVVDTGIGMSPEQCQRVFQPFTQAEDSTSRKYGGTGLGLTISKNLVELMHGQMGVKSALGQGSTFWLTLPLKTAQDSEEITVPAYASLSGRRVLIVDDNATNRRVLEEYLKRWGARSASANDAFAAYDLLEESTKNGKPFDMALLDYNMPEQDGFELARRIRANPAFDAVPLVLLTSVCQHGHAQESKEIGFQAYLTKPVRREQLYLCLGKLLAKKTQDAPAQKQSFITRHTLNEDERRLARRHVLLAEDNSVNQKVACKMLQKLGCTVTVAANGEQALEALEKNYFDMILMDCQMPQMDGYEATQAIRADRPHFNTPIIALTANAMEGDREKCLAAGMDDYLAKPLVLQALSQKLDTWIKPNAADPTEQAAS